MNVKCITHYRPVGRRDDNFDSVDGWGVEMPAGSRVLSVFPDGTGITALTLEPAEGVVVGHPILLAQVHVSIDPMLGRRVGDYLGMVNIRQGKAVTQVHLFQDLPWPEKKSAIIAP